MVTALSDFLCGQISPNFLRGGERATRKPSEIRCVRRYAGLRTLSIKSRQIMHKISQIRIKQLEAAAKSRWIIWGSNPCGGTKKQEAVRQKLYAAVICLKEVTAPSPPLTAYRH